MEDSPQPARPDRAGCWGYTCLSTLTAVGLLGGGGLFVWGVAVFMNAQAAVLEDAGDAEALVDTLEGAVVLTAVGVLVFLVGVVSFVVMVKELGDDAERQRRGPV